MSATAATLPPQAAVRGAEAAASALPVIVTKIRVPRRRPGLLSRRRLVDFIHTHLDHKLILISAPAGYGKTSLLTDFVQDTDLPVCWYTLDPFDRDLRVFLEHLIAAIALRFTTFGERSRTLLRGMADPGQDLYPLVATLVQEIMTPSQNTLCWFWMIITPYKIRKGSPNFSTFLRPTLTRTAT